MQIRELARISDYPAMVDALRARADELQVSRATLDDVSGLADGHVGKLLAPNPPRRVGMQSLGPLLGALCVQLVLVEDAAAMQRYGSRIKKRDERLVRHNKPKEK